MRSVSATYTDLTVEITQVMCMTKTGFLLAYVRSGGAINNL